MSGPCADGATSPSTGHRSRARPATSSTVARPSTVRSSRSTAGDRRRSGGAARPVPGHRRRGHRGAWYAVSSLPTIESEGGPLSRRRRPTRAGADGRRHRGHGRCPPGDRPVARPWRPIIGSEHLALLLRGAGPGGHDVGAEMAEAFRIVRRDLGVEAVRAHAILDDTLGVYRDTRRRTGPRLHAGG